MNNETNENELEANLNNNTTINNNIENAFSDLISQYFEDGSNKQNADNIEQGTVLDWDSVANGQLLYTNIAQNINNNENNDLQSNNIQNNIYGANFKNIGINLENTNNGVLYTNLNPNNEQNLNVNLTNANEVNEVKQENTNVNGIYDELGNLNTQEMANSVYNVVKRNEELLNGNKANTVNGISNDIVNNANGINNEIGTEFKLTQGNLPAKIGFWTKVRNFFRTDAKITYSVQQQTQENKNVWNRLQNFFSFGK